MSTKIYNGYRIESPSLDEAIPALLSLRHEAKEETLKYILQKNLFSAINMYDSLLVKDILMVNYKKIENVELNNELNNETEDTEKKFIPNLTKSALTNAYSQSLDKFWNKEDKAEDDSNIEITVVVFPNAVEIDGKKNYLLCLYADKQLNDCITSQWKDLGVKEYGYWNNTDEPEDVTMDQWEMRESHWDYVLTGKGKTGVPSVEGISLTISQVNQYFYDLTSEKNQEILKSLIETNKDKVSLERRVNEYVEEFMITTIMNDLLAQQKGNEKPEKMTDQFVQDSLDCYFKAKKIIRKNQYSEDMAQLFEKVKLELTDRLDYPLLLENLNQPLEDSINQRIKQSIKVENISKSLHKLK